MLLPGYNNIWVPTDEDPVAPLQNLFVQLGSSINVALESVRSNTPIMVADKAERDLFFPSPVQGSRAYRKDIDVEETYYAAYSNTTNRAGSTVPGWYPSPGQNVHVLIPINGSRVFPSQSGGGFTNDIMGSPIYSPGASEYFSVNGDSDVNCLRSMVLDIEFACPVSVTDGAGSAKAYVLKNNHNWIASPPGATIMLEAELANSSLSTFRGWLRAHTKRAMVNSGDFVQLGAFNNAYPSATRYGNTTIADAPHIFARYAFEAPRRS